VSAGRNRCHWTAAAYVAKSPRPSGDTAWQNARPPSGQHIRMRWMEERAIAGAKVRPNRRQSPALHTQPKMFVACSAKAFDHGDHQRVPKSLAPMCLIHYQLPQLATDGKVEATASRIVNSTRGADPLARASMSKKEEPSRLHTSEQIVPRSIGQRRIEFHNCARILPTRCEQRHHRVSEETAGGLIGRSASRIM
jgi:hypothetical protein